MSSATGTICRGRRPRTPGPQGPRLRGIYQARPRGAPVWRFELEEGYAYWIRDRDRNVAGYFDPDYGADPYEDADRVERMHKESAAVGGGFLTLPMVKLGVFAAVPVRADFLESHVAGALERVRAWRAALEGLGDHHISISHTDEDVLTVTLAVGFGRPVPLEKGRIAGQITPLLDGLRARGLL